jgi:hypothetical protein
MTNTNKKGPVGYGNPPDHSKFKKGKSGNPSGRGKTEKRLGLQDLLKQLMFEEITVRVNGKKTKMPNVMVMLRALMAQALKGNEKASQILFKEIGGLKFIMEEEKRELTLADKAFLEAVRKESEKWRC